MSYLQKRPIVPLCRGYTSSPKTLHSLLYSLSSFPRAPSEIGMTPSEPSLSLAYLLEAMASFKTIICHAAHFHSCSVSHHLDLLHLVYPCHLEKCLRLLAGSINMQEQVLVWACICASSRKHWGVRLHDLQWEVFPSRATVDLTKAPSLPHLLDSFVCLFFHIRSF